MIKKINTFENVKEEIKSEFDIVGIFRAGIWLFLTAFSMPISPVVYNKLINLVQVKNYEIVVKIFHISHNLT